MAPSVVDTSDKNVTGDDPVVSYKQQVGGLVDVGVGLLMIETVFDRQTAKLLRSSQILP